MIGTFSGSSPFTLGERAAAGDIEKTTPRFADRYLPIRNTLVPLVQ